MAETAVRTFGGIGVLGRVPSGSREGRIPSGCITFFGSCHYPKWKEPDELQEADARALDRHTPYSRVSVQHTCLFYTRGLRAAGGARKKRRRAMSQSERFVTGDECPSSVQF